MKRCTKCGLELPATLEYFHAKYSVNKAALRAECRICRNKARFVRENKDRAKYNKMKSDWFKNNPDRAYQINLRKNNKRRSSHHEPYTILEVFEKYGTVCYLCSQEIDLSISRIEPQGLNIDHLFPKVEGGHDTLANVRPTHRKCNQDKGRKIYGTTQRRQTAKAK